MPAFLDLSKGEQGKLLEKLKMEMDTTWDGMAKLLGVKRRMVFHYLGETSRLPIGRIALACKKKKIPFLGYASLKTAELSNCYPKEPKKPKLGEELAEFLGALGGDGNVCETGNAITITCSAIVDYIYVDKHIRRLFTTLFGLTPKVFNEETRIKCRVYSKRLKQFLSEKHEFPVGNRKNRMRIPGKIMRNKKLLRCYLRGLFDTDGSFHRKRENSGVVEYISCSPKYLKDIKDALTLLGFSASLSGKSVYIYDQRQVHRFFKIIKPKNLKHITKYKIFRKTKKVPIHKEIVKIMRPSSSGRISPFQGDDLGSNPSGRIKFFWWGDE